MVNPEILNDYAPGDWIGINYQQPENSREDFPTIIREIGDKNKYVDVSIFPNSIKKRLETKFITDIWHLERTPSFSER